eukprot:scaffold7176_cov134-Cylindrotheca_fusiformis.AAC.11
MVTRNRRLSRNPPSEEFCPEISVLIVRLCLDTLRLHVTLPNAFCNPSSMIIYAGGIIAGLSINLLLTSIADIIAAIAMAEACEGQNSIVQRVAMTFPSSGS